MATARSKAAGTSPRLPPSPIKASAVRVSDILGRTRACDSNPDVIEGRGDRRMRLVHGDAHAAYFRTACQHRLGYRAGGRLDQPIASAAKRLADRFHDKVVGNSVLELVAARRVGKVDAEHEIKLKGLADLALVLHHAVKGVQREAVDKDRVAHRLAHRACLIAAATASACTVGATSWTRMMAAPFSTASRLAAIEPPRRSIGSDGTTALMKRLREAPTRSGASKLFQVRSCAKQARLCSAVLPKPMPGSSTMRSCAMPALQAISSEREKNSETSVIMSIDGSALSRLCMMMIGAPYSATTRAMSGSRCRPHTSLTIAAPASSAQAARAAFCVSMETGMPMAATADRIGSSRARSSSSGTGRMPP